MTTQVVVRFTVVQPSCNYNPGINSNVIRGTSFTGAECGLVPQKILIFSLRSVSSSRVSA